MTRVLEHAGAQRGPRVIGRADDHEGSRHAGTDKRGRAQPPSKSSDLPRHALCAHTLVRQLGARGRGWRSQAGCEGRHTGAGCVRLVVCGVGGRVGRDTAPAAVADRARPAHGDERGDDPQIDFLLVRGEEGPARRTGGQRRSKGRHRMWLRRGARHGEDDQARDSLIASPPLFGEEIKGQSTPRGPVLPYVRVHTWPKQPFHQCGITGCKFCNRH